MPKTILDTDQISVHCVTRALFGGLRSPGLRFYPTSLDNDQLDARLLYFTILPLQSSTYFEHYMLIIRRLKLYRCSIWYRQWPSSAQVERERVEFSLNLCTGRPMTGGRYQILHQYNSTSWWWECNARNM